MDFYGNYVMTIDGSSPQAAATFEVVNPAMATAFAKAPDCTREQLDGAVAAAQIAFDGWSRTSIEARRERLLAAADALLLHKDDLARLFTREQGRPFAGAVAEIESAAAWLQGVTALSPPVHISEDSAAQFIETRYVPLGVVGAITPWNFPVVLAMWKIGPALLAGNTMVLKPSPFTPLCTLKIGELFRPIFPPGVFNVISGGDELGPWMTSHPGIRKISFTGSTATGRRVMASAAGDLKRLTLELGGNDAAIVMSDVDLDQVAPQIFHGAFFNSAQICIATKRLYAHDAIYDGLRDRLVKIAAETKIGDGAEQGTDLGPIQNKRQFERVKALLDEARDSGLALIQGEAVPKEGYFVPVTIVDNPPECAPVVQEEAFGPILPMLRFTDVDEVIARANASEYGLAGAIWSKDIDAAVAIARRLETGTVWINQNLNVRPDTPFAGHKQSGFGSEHGIDGLLEYMAPQTVYVAR